MSEEKRLNQLEVAELSGINRSTLSKFITGVYKPLLVAEKEIGADGRAHNYFKQSVVNTWIEELKAKRRFTKAGRKNKKLSLDV